MTKNKEPVWDYSELLEEAKDRIEEKAYMEGENHGRQSTKANRSDQ